MSAEPKPDENPDPLAITEEEIDSVIAEAEGDPREAIRLLIRDLAVMAVDADAASSRGFIRGRFASGARRQAAGKPL